MSYERLQSGAFADAVGGWKTSKDTILAIALDSGFNNKVSFYNNFKRVTGLSPKEYRQRISGAEQG